VGKRISSLRTAVRGGGARRCGCSEWWVAARLWRRVREEEETGERLGARKERRGRKRT